VSACHRGDWSYGPWDRIPPGVAISRFCSNSVARPGANPMTFEFTTTTPALVGSRQHKIILFSKRST
jgi:hypothetical protein